MLKEYDILIDDVLEDILEITHTDDKQLNLEIREYFLNGGKRVRVLLLLICAKLGNFEKNKKNIIRLASIVEIIHTASLIHDDIIDKADTRRGKITLNRKYNDDYAVQVGDYLFSVVLNEISKISDERIHSYLTNTLKELCIGELIQAKDLYNLNIRRLDYLKKIKRKTAILIAFACVAGSIISEAKEEDTKSSYLYGYYLGMSYQIIDDYLDFAGDSKLGKDVGQDLLNGNLTLPSLIAKEERPTIFTNFSSESSEEEKKEMIHSIKNETSALVKTLEASENYLKKAEKTLENINEEVKEQLLLVMNRLARRDY